VIDNAGNLLRLGEALAQALAAVIVFGVEVDAASAVVASPPRYVETVAWVTPRWAAIPSWVSPRSASARASSARSVGRTSSVTISLGNRSDMPPGSRTPLISGRNAPNGYNLVILLTYISVGTDGPGMTVAELTGWCKGPMDDVAADGSEGDRERLWELFRTSARHEYLFRDAARRREEWLMGGV